MNKIVKISFILVIILFSIMTSVNATFTCVVNLKNEEKQYKKGEELVVDVEISNIQADKGIVALGATLEYDKNSLEILKMESKNGWSTPSYNNSNGKIIVDKSGFATGNEVIFQIVFKVKGTSQENLKIELKDISIADGNQESKIANAVSVIKIEQGGSNSEITPPEQGQETDKELDKNIENTEEKPFTDKLKDGILPKTGSSSAILGLIVVLCVFAVICLRKIKIINKNRK